MPVEFRGRSLALSAAGFGAATGALGVQEAELWSLLAVETGGSGFLADRRPQILFERHIFHRLTGGRYDDGDISDKKPGGYGPKGAAQYDRLARAAAKDREAALRATSWGLGQVLGDNCAMAGFAGVEEMVAAMSDEEDAQLAAVASFIRSSKLDVHLRAHDWTAFAAGYNGPAFAKNQYDTKLLQYFSRFQAGDMPSLGVRAAQLYLTFEGFQPGPVDGMLGGRTRAALLAFQGGKGLPPTGEADDATLAALAAALQP